jgi:hypothetical protein
MALAIDLAMLLTSHSEAQRISDASSLAGASAYAVAQWALDDPATSDSAIARAKLYAGANEVRGRLVDPTTAATEEFEHPADGFGYIAVGPELTVQALPNAITRGANGEEVTTPKVRVWITRSALPAWFARFVGMTNLGVKAMAAAVAAEASRLPYNEDQCIMPIAMPDWWHDPRGDRNGNRLPDPGEDWEWDEGDVYDPYQQDAYDPNPQPGLENDYHGTGLGSGFRDGAVGDSYQSDLGRRIWVKAGPKGQKGKGSGGEAPGGMDDMWAPGNFGFWAMPDPGNDCQPSTGAAWLASNILTCNSCPISASVEAPYEALNEPGNIASIKDEMEQLYAMDPNAEWREGCTCATFAECGSCIVGSKYANPLKSPRVRPVAVFSPDQQGSINGRKNIYFNNFASIFFEGGGSKDIFWPDFQIYGRFLGPASGTGGGGPELGQLERYLRLVE